MEDSRMLIDKLRREIMSGKITCEDITKKLTVAIENAYNSDSPDVEFIDSCEDFLWEIGTQGKQKFVSPTPKYLNAIQKRTKPTEHRRLSLGIAKRCAIMGAAFAILLILTQGVLRFEWFSTQSSHDEQEYIIQGHSVDIELIAQGIAEYNGLDRFQTDDWAAFTEHLGFIPSIVRPDALGASGVQYTAVVESDAIVITILYTGINDGGSVVMTVYYFANAENARVTIQQDSKGVAQQIDGVTVYVTTNLNRATCIWRTDATIYQLSGDIDTAQALLYVAELIGGNESE